MTPLTTLKNIGPQTASWLEDVGVDSVEAVEQLGVVEVYRKVRKAYPYVTLTLLWSLQGGLLDVPFSAITPDMRQQLLAELEKGKPDRST